MHFKIVVAGNGCVGKTTFLNKYCNDIFTYDYQPTVMDVYEKIIVPLDLSGDVCDQPDAAKRANTPIKISFWDMAGQDNYRDFRGRYYQNTDLFILIYAINSLPSFYHVRNKWIPEIRSHSECKNVPILIVGTKLDTRNYYDYYGDPKISQCVTKDQTDNLRYLEKCKVIECSSYTGENVEKVISTALDLLPIRNAETKTNCVVC